MTISEIKAQVEFLKLNRPVVWIVAAVIDLLLLFFGLAYGLEFRPDPVERLSSTPHPTPLSDTLTVVSWNIGYAGLGDNMDFFYDGGSRVRDSRERTELNLTHITATLQQINADIILLQEVDSSSRRSYHLDQVEALRRAFPAYSLTFARNYDAWWVPIPVSNPLGGVKSGVVTLARRSPLEAVRYQYPSEFPFPTRMFNLKRCLLSTDFLLSNGDTLRVNNTHNTAYDTGGMRSQEMTFLRDFLGAHRRLPTLTGGDWNQYPSGYSPSEAALSNAFFVPQRIDPKLFDGLGRFVFDSTAPSLRYLDTPYQAGSTQTLTDFFFISPSIKVLSIHTLDLGFTSSDHHPVVVRIVCEKNHSKVF